MQALNQVVALLITNVSSFAHIDDKVVAEHKRQRAPTLTDIMSAVPSGEDSDDRTQQLCYFTLFYLFFDMI